MKLKINASSNRDGVSTNFTTSYIQGETLHIQTLPTTDSNYIKKALESFQGVTEGVDVSVNLQRDGKISALISSGVLTMSFGSGPQTKSDVNKYLRSVLVKKAGLIPA